MLQKIQMLFMSLRALFGPERNFGRRGLTGRSKAGCKRGARLGAYIKISNSAEGIRRKGAPGFALWEQQGFGRVGFNPFVSVLLSIVSLPGLPDPSVRKQRLLSWCQCASSSDFRELWVRLLMGNLELSCLRALPAHFPELSSHHCMRDLGQVWQKVSSLGRRHECRYHPKLSRLSAPGATRAKPVNLQQSKRSLQQQMENMTRTRLQC